MTKKAKKILIIEDETMLQSTLVNQLTEEGYNVRGCTTAADAFALIEEEKPHLILTDLVLLGTDGFEILKTLHDNPAYSDIPAIALSNLGDEDDIERAKALGAKEYIVKAENSIESIIGKVKNILD